MKLPLLFLILLFLIPVAYAENSDLVVNSTTNTTLVYVNSTNYTDYYNNATNLTSSTKAGTFLLALNIEAKTNNTGKSLNVKIMSENGEVINYNLTSSTTWQSIPLIYPLTVTSGNHNYSLFFKTDSNSFSQIRKISFTTIFQSNSVNFTTINLDASLLNNLNATNITLGTLPNARINTTYLNETLQIEEDQVTNLLTDLGLKLNTSTYNGDYPNSTVAGNLANWNATYNSTYDVTTSTVNGNLANWNNTYNATYDAKPTLNQVNTSAQLSRREQVTGQVGADDAQNTSINSKEPAISAGTEPRFWGWDKTFRTIGSYFISDFVVAVRTNISAGTNLSYNSGTGVIDDVRINYPNQSHATSITNLQSNDTTHDSQINNIQTNETGYDKLDGTRSWTGDHNAGGYNLTNIFNIHSPSGKYYLKNESVLCGTNMTCTYNANGTVTLISSGGGGGGVTLDQVNQSAQLSREQITLQTGVDDAQNTSINSKTTLNDVNSSAQLQSLAQVTSLQSLLDAMNLSSANNNTASQGRDDSINNTKINKSGDTMSGDLNMDSNNLTNVYNITDSTGKFYLRNVSVLAGTNVTVDQNVDGTVTISSTGGAASGITNETVDPFNMNASNITSGTLPVGRVSYLNKDYSFLITVSGNTYNTYYPNESVAFSGTVLTDIFNKTIQSSSPGGKIVFGSGTFLKASNNTPMLINISYVTVEGQGDSTIFQYANNSTIGDFFKLDEVKGCGISKIRIDGSTNILGTTSPYSANGILANRVSDCTFEKTNISNMKSYGIFLDNLSNGNMVTSNRGYANNYSGVLLQNSHNNQILGNNYTGSPNGHSFYTEIAYNNIFANNVAGSNTFDCFRMVQANYSIINSNSCQYSQRNGLSITQTHNATFTSNDLNNVGQAIRFETGSSWNLVANNKIDNNRGTAFPFGGVPIILQDGTTNNTVSGNTVYNSSTEGFYQIQLGGKGHVVTNNVLRRRNQDPYSNAIYISGTDITVMGNDVGSGGLFNDGTNTKFGYGNLCWNGTLSTTTCIAP